MSHLEKQIAVVRSRLLVNRLIDALAWGALVISGVVLLGVTIDRLFAVSLPAAWRWPVAIGGVSLWLIAAGLAAYVHRPTRAQAAVAIDEKLGLQERFSTAVYVAPSSDQFAMAAVHDAQETAQRVDLAGKFPLEMGKQWRAAGVLLTLALAGALFLPRFDFFGNGSQVAKATNENVAQQSARSAIAKAIAMVSSTPRFKNDELDMLKDELNIMARLPKLNDPNAAGRLANRAMELSEEISGSKVQPPKSGVNNARGLQSVEKGETIEGDDVHWGQEQKPNRRPHDNSPRTDRPKVAADTIAGKMPVNLPPATGPGAKINPHVPPGGKDNPAAGNTPRGGNPNGNAPGNIPGNQPGQGKQNAAGPNNGPGNGGMGDRSVTPAPYAPKPERSPSQDDADGKILARDLVRTSADTGKQRMMMAETAKAARERAAEEVDADHVSGPAQSAARKYFKTTE